MFFPIVDEYEFGKVHEVLSNKPILARFIKCIVWLTVKLYPGIKCIDFYVVVLKILSTKKIN